jgi:hypothetical protein
VKLAMNLSFSSLSILTMNLKRAKLCAPLGINSLTNMLQ